jgi:hypothetical protein
MSNLDHYYRNNSGSVPRGQTKCWFIEPGDMFVQRELKGREKRKTVIVVLSTLNDRLAKTHFYNGRLVVPTEPLSFSCEKWVIVKGSLAGDP